MARVVEQLFTVTGMSCAGCVGAVQDILSKSPGVELAEVNLLEGRTRVRYNPQVTSPEELQRAVRALGYDMLIQESARERESQMQAESRRALYLLRVKLAVTILLALLIMSLGMWHDSMGLSARSANWINWVLASVVYFYGGGGYHKRALKQLSKRTFTMDVLISLSTSVAYFFSFSRLFFEEGSPADQLFGTSYFDIVGMIFSFVLLGKYIEERAKQQTQDALHKLIGLAPERALVRLEGGELEERPVEELQVGDVVQLRQGDRVPVDGILLERGSFDESSITGEPIPYDKVAGDEVFSGTVAVGGATTFRVTMVGDETLLGRIVEAVRKAQASKAPIQRLADRISGVFVPAVLAVALLTLLGWGLLSSSATPWLHGLYFAVTVLVVACPCALGLATPTAISVAMGRASGMGLLIRDASALELLSKVTDLIYDKTGTLTVGAPTITGELWLERSEQNISLLVTAEEHTSHPLGRALVEAYRSERSPQYQLIQIEEVAGGGLRFVYNGKEYKIGNRGFAKIDDSNEELISFEEAHPQSTLSYFVCEGELLAVFALDDTLRAEVPQALHQLRSDLGLQLHLLSGDREVRVAHFADQLGIKQASGGLSPLDKKAYIEQLQSEERVVAMVGDGINDSPALAVADVSVALGSGSDIASDVAMLTSISDSPFAVERAIKLSKRTVRIIKENFFWAFCYNIVAIPIATGLLYPHVALSPVIGAAAMAGSSIIVVLNSLRLRR
ncbi:MAG: heavy metal translocating P-type ATPase [Porphyromonas sp.]|nr:heavy metal translocating P-type ATPase [Porphyromonas sp.]